MKIDKDSHGEVITVRLVGHFQSGHIRELRKQLEPSGQRSVLDLTEVTLVDVEVVRFLSTCEAGGVGIVNCPPYIREWMKQEQANERIIGCGLKVTPALQAAGADMPNTNTAIITGASRGIGAGLVEAFLKEDYNVVATSRRASQSLTASETLVLVDGDIGQYETAANAVEAAIKHFGAIDVLVTNAGLFHTKPFTDFTTEEIDALVSTNLLGFLYIAQLTVKQMLKQKSGCVVSISAALADNPIAGINGSVPMITKGGLNAVIRSLAIEYAREGIRFNAVAPGAVDTPMHDRDPKEFLRTLQPMGGFADVKDIADAVLYLAQASQVTGEVLHVDGGAHVGRW